MIVVVGELRRKRDEGLENGILPFRLEVVEGNWPIVRSGEYRSDYWLAAIPGLVQGKKL